MTLRNKKELLKLEEQTELAVGQCHGGFDNGKSSFGCTTGAVTCELSPTYSATPKFSVIARPFPITLSYELIVS